MKNLHITERNIYKIGKELFITNDEEIKEGNYFLSCENTIEKHKGSVMPIYLDKKIILTTDADLIKDGVQAIDDEFLEWFVKNPSCEEIEVKRKTIIEYEPIGHAGGVYKYILIIPKVEQKELRRKLFTLIKSLEQEEPKHIPYTGKVWEPPKQETLEEVARNYRDLKLPDDLYDGFIAGAKWQQERMYSEEEVESLLQRFRSYSYNHGCGNAEFEEWFNEVKKR